MSKSISCIEGTKYGRLTVIAKLSTKQDGRFLWKLACDCGNIVEKTGSRVVSGHITSCGCAKIEAGNRNRVLAWKAATKPAGVSGLNRAYDAYQRNAKQANREFLLTKDEFRVIVQQPCSYCGAEGTERYPSKCGGYVANGIDRVDNTKGYTTDNCVPCCTRCNVGKMDLSYYDFMAWVAQVYEYSINKQVFSSTEKENYGF